MPTREDRLAALLSQPERVVEARHDVPGLLQKAAPDTLFRTAENMIVTHAAGAALRQARQQQEWTMRQAGEASGRSAPRVKAIKDTGTDIHLGTVVEHARALGYAARLVLTPLDGPGKTIEADLSGSLREGKEARRDVQEGVTELPAVRRKTPSRVK